MSDVAAKELAKALVVATALAGAVALLVTGHASGGGWMLVVAVLLW